MRGKLYHVLVAIKATTEIEARQIAQRCIGVAVTSGAELHSWSLEEIPKAGDPIALALEMPSDLPMPEKK